MLSRLTHLDDMKVTYTNGFHVNPVITHQSKLSLEEHPYNFDYSTFFKAAQPVIDDTALAPPQYTLVQGIYL